MKKPVLKTYKILKEKACNADIDEDWAGWAIEMIEEGFENESLYQLAGISKPYNQFELHHLTNQVLKELNFDYSDKQKTLKNYAYYIIKVNIENTTKYTEVLKEFRDIYYELDMDREYQDFAFLYWAKTDLIYSDYQHYWDGADRTNIDDIIKQQFVDWIIKFDQQNKITT